MNYAGEFRPPISQPHMVEMSVLIRWNYERKPMPNEDDEHKRLIHFCEQKREEYLRRSSIRFLECAINLCVSHMSMEDVAQLLESQANLLREHR
jgi:hypothetical protein